MTLTSLAAKLVPVGIKRKILTDALTQGEAAVRAELLAAKPTMPPMLNLILTAIVGGMFTSAVIYVASDDACLDLSVKCLKLFGGALAAGALNSVINLLRQLQTNWDGLYRRPGDPPNFTG